MFFKSCYPPSDIAYVNQLLCVYVIFSSSHIKCAKCVCGKFDLKWPNRIKIKTTEDQTSILHMQQEVIILKIYKAVFISPFLNRYILILSIKQHTSLGKKQRIVFKTLKLSRILLTA